MFASKSRMMWNETACTKHREGEKEREKLTLNTQTSSNLATQEKTKNHSNFYYYECCEWGRQSESSGDESMR